MIDFIGGQIKLDGGNTLSVLDYDDLDAFAEQGLIKKRYDAGGLYYYVDASSDGIRFGVYVSLGDDRIEHLVLRWLDGPCTSKGWDDVSENALNDEYRLLLNFVEKKSGCPPDNVKNRQRTWRFAWGKVDVSNEPRDFIVNIFMKPR